MGKRFIKTIFLLVVAIFIMSAFFNFTIAATSTIDTIDANALDLALLQVRVDTLQNLNERILNSVYWTLGILATIFLGLISVNLFFSISGNKREIQKIKKDFTDTARNEILASESKILEKVSALNQKEFNDIRSDVLGTARNEILASESKILEKVSALNQKEFNDIRSDVLSTTKNDILSSEAKIIEKINNNDKVRINDIEALKRQCASLKNDVDGLDTRIKEFEIDRFAQKGQQGQIMGMIELLGKSIDKNITYEIPSRLIKIRDYVDKTEVRAFVAADLNKQLAKIENNDAYKTMVEEIRLKVKIFAD